MDLIKEAFARAKQDMIEMKQALDSIKKELADLKQQVKIQQTNTSINSTDQDNQQTDKPTQSSLNPSIQQINPTDTSNPENSNAQIQAYKGLKTQDIRFSSGNEGVPTNKQTNQQTNQQTEKTNKNEALDHLEKVSELLESLDSIKKELRTTFKKLTKQEMIIFTTIYQLSEQGNTVDYPIIAQKLHLSESSIREYVQKIIKKGVPIQKSKENNKKVRLTIASDFKKIASLQTIIQLREL